MGHPAVRARLFHQVGTSMVIVVLAVAAWSPHGHAAKTAETTSSAWPQRAEAFVSGADGYHTYRIPSIIKLNTGDLMIFAEGRKLSASVRGATIPVLMLSHALSDMIMMSCSLGVRSARACVCVA